MQIHLHIFNTISFKYRIYNSIQYFIVLKIDRNWKCEITSLLLILLLFDRQNKMMLLVKRLNANWMRLSPKSCLQKMVSPDRKTMQPEDMYVCALYVCEGHTPPVLRSKRSVRRTEQWIEMHERTRRARRAVVRWKSNLFCRSPRVVLATCFQIVTVDGRTRDTYGHKTLRTPRRATNSKTLL